MAPWPIGCISLLINVSANRDFAKISSTDSISKIFRQRRVQRDMRYHCQSMRGGQFFIRAEVQHHREVIDAAKLREQLRMARIIMPRPMHARG